jgi:hypothetical protein
VTSLIDTSYECKEGNSKNVQPYLTTLWFCSWARHRAIKQMKGEPYDGKKLTPILFAEEIEPCLKFWMERLGFEKTIDVP